jgi:hypothetical protein
MCVIPRPGESISLGFRHKYADRSYLSAVAPNVQR